MRYVASWFLVGGMLLACGLDEGGGATLDPDAEAAPDVAVVDGGADVPPLDATSEADVVLPPSGPCDVDANTCQSPDVPVGWDPVAYVESPSSGCPVEFPTTLDVVTKVALGTAQCGCSCSVVQQPTCDKGTAHTYYSTGNGCGTQGLDLNLNGPGCLSLGNGGGLASYFAGSPVAATGGACAEATTPTGSVATTPARLCVASAQCRSAACAGHAPAGYRSCIAQDGDLTCPGGSAFANKVLVAASAAAQCTACAPSGCTLTPACSTPKAAFFSDTVCSTNAVVQVPMDTTCVATNNSGTTVRGVKYTATPSATCQSTATSAASLSLTQPKTLCCR